MIIIYRLIFAISIDGITTKNSSSNRILIIGLCQTDNARLESSRIPSVHYYYFHFSSQSSLSSSSFLSSLLLLSYCLYLIVNINKLLTIHQVVLLFFVLHRASFLPNIVNSQQASSFHHHDAVLSVVDQPLSTSTVTLMSSKENNLLVDTDSGNLSTTINPSLYSLSSISSATTTISNASLLHPSLSQRGNRTFNIASLAGCIGASIVLIIIIIYAFVKCRNRDEGSYKIDESKNFVTNSNVENLDNGGRSGKLPSLNPHRQKLLTTNEQNGVNAREWYV